jgi:hypothetical protein
MLNIQSHKTKKRDYCKQQQISVDQNDRNGFRNLKPIEDFASQCEESCGKMVDNQSSVVETDSLIVRPPDQDDEQIRERQAQHEIHSVLAQLFDENVQREDDLDQKVVQEVNQDVTWLEVFSIWVVLIVFKLFHH